MNELSRRDLLRLLGATAAAAVGTSLGVASVEAAAPAAPAATPTPAANGLPPSIQSHVAEWARRAAQPAETPALGPVHLAIVAHCRSWERRIYLYVNEAVRGFVEVNDRGFAIAAACQLAGKPVAMRAYGHNPAWGQGVGMFEGVQLAVDPADLQPRPAP